MEGDFAEVSPLFGPTALRRILVYASCPAGSDYIRKIKDVVTPKFLLVGTRGDPPTPYRWTIETAKRLGDSAVLLDNKGDGHTGYTSCTARCPRAAHPAARATEPCAGPRSPHLHSEGEPTYCGKSRPGPAT